MDGARVALRKQPEKRSDCEKRLRITEEKKRACIELEKLSEIQNCSVQQSGRIKMKEDFEYE